MSGRGGAASRTGSGRRGWWDEGGAASRNGSGREDWWGGARVRARLGVGREGGCEGGAMQDGCREGRGQRVGRGARRGTARAETKAGMVSRLRRKVGRLSRAVGGDFGGEWDRIEAMTLFPPRRWAVQRERRRAG